ncbi:5-(carboxyamino)imidazole ribonucleotide synthase [Hoeflea sp. YIM 152468]|uniref:5-(carboxyamino)imidazole ribonucleotide synthase n=1 Tax=Hoeflea sp. YIM 152468 TaxID=3031759 RepID=UPI0023DCE62A|nr:5-(carboxyamino)imidazole ribonucleotide synthase [Hoeflea sp. YIM 152468]MDF1607907.1 5-(carboxyamino)imidazole ribonucleotide synthase [Hoeflea sp. YIM 152468]
MSAQPLAPGAVIGIVGGGQLGRMLAMAAAKLGYKTVILEPDTQAPAAQVATRQIVAGYDDPAALQQLAELCDVVTYEFENVPADAVRWLEKQLPVRPGSKALEVAQDRLLEKAMARQLGAGTALFAPVAERADLDDAIAVTGLPAVLKTTRLGYDGKGQAKLVRPEDADIAFDAMNGQMAILESFVHFDCEVSVIAARGISGEVRAFDIAENMHRNHILHTSTVPSTLGPNAQTEALEIATAIAGHLDYIGVFAVEFFAVREGGSHRLLVNEIAPRVHNSGHWTEAACAISQFEQHIRAIVGLPLGSPERHSDCVMENLIGEDVDAVAGLAGEPNAVIHLYGKSEARPGRKMGHVTRITPSKHPIPS